MKGNGLGAEARDYALAAIKAFTEKTEILLGEKEALVGCAGDTPGEERTLAYRTICDAVLV